MADFPSTNVRINSQLSPFTDTQTFPLFDSAHGLGGLRTVGTTAEMNAIFDRRRTRGMMVYVSGVSAYYALIGTTANSGWTTEFQIGTGTNILPLNNTFTGVNTFSGGLCAAGGITFNGTVNGATASFNRLLTASAGISASTGLFGTLQANSGVTFNADAYVGATLTVQGNFVVNGSTTIINSTTIEVDDKLILLAQGTTLNTALNDGGIELGSGVGATPKSIKWINATSAWTSSEDFNLVSGKVYEINGTTVLSSSALGTGITSSSLQSVGTISSGTWQGTAVGATYGGTGRTTYTIGDILYANGTSSLTVLGASTAGRLLAANGAGAAPEYKQLLIRDADANSVATETSGAGTLTMTIQNASTSVKGLSRYDSFNFSVAAGVVGITAIDGGSYT